MRLQLVLIDVGNFSNTSFSCLHKFIYIRHIAFTFREVREFYILSKRVCVCVSKKNKSKKNALLSNGCSERNCSTFDALYQMFCFIVYSNVCLICFLLQNYSMYFERCPSLGWILLHLILETLEANNFEFLRVFHLLLWQIRFKWSYFWN